MRKDITAKKIVAWKTEHHWGLGKYQAQSKRLSGMSVEEYIDAPFSKSDRLAGFISDLTRLLKRIAK